MQKTGPCEQGSAVSKKRASQPEQATPRGSQTITADAKHFWNRKGEIPNILGFILHHVVWQTKSVCRIPTLMIHEAAGPASDDVAHHGGDLRYRC